MNGRDLWAMYRDSHSGDTGIVLGTFDDLTTQQRMVWERLAEAAQEFIYEKLRESGVMWEPTS